MPLYLKPGLRAAIHLRIDEDDEPKPTFYAKALSMDQQIALSEAIDAMHEPDSIRGKTVAQLCDEAVVLLQEYLHGWANLPDDFTLRQLSYHEVRELLIKICHGQGMTFEEKKD